MEKNFNIHNLKVALIYGNSDTNGINKDGHIELILKDDDDTAHYFYMKEFLKNNFTNEPSVQNIIAKHDVNSIFFELQKLGHIAFAENTSFENHPSGLLYIPKSISKNQKESLFKFQNQLNKENYNVTVLFNLFRSEDGIIMGNQLSGNSSILDKFTEFEKFDDRELEL